MSISPNSNPFKIHSLHDLSRDCNKMLDIFLTNMTRYRINLLMVDFFEETDNLDQSMNANRYETQHTGIVLTVGNRENCNDDARYRALSPNKQDCRDWAADGLCTSNTTIRAYCPLSCGLCKKVCHRTL